MGEIIQMVEFCKSGTPCSQTAVREDGIRDWTTTVKAAHVAACVPSPYVLLIGDIIIHFEGNRFNVSCFHCI